MIRRVMAALSALAVGAVLLAAPAPALPVRTFGTSAAVGPLVADTFGVSTAVLPDGTVGVAWSSAGSTVRMAVRRPGATAFTPLTSYTVPGGSLGNFSPPTRWPLVTLRAAGSEFLLGWAETGPPGDRVRVSRVPGTAAAIPAPVTVAGSEGAEAMNPAFGTATDGSAVAAWVVAGPYGYEIRAARRAGTSGTWQALDAAGWSTVPLELSATIDTSRSVTLGWLELSGSLFAINVRSYRGGAWGLTTVPGTFTSELLGMARFVDATSSGAATTLAVVDTIPGTTDYSGDDLARGVRLLQRASSTAPWTLSPAVTGPARYAVSPSVVMAPDGSAVLTFQDISDGTTPADSSSVATLVAQRRGATGALGAATLVDAVSIDRGLISTVTSSGVTPALGSDGTLVLPLPAPAPGGGGSVLLGVATAWRSGWNAPFVQQPLLAGELPLGQLVAGMVVDPAGRATVSYLGDTTLLVRAATTALPKPLARSRAALSTTAPEVGEAVTCSSAWTGATSLAHRWLRGGTVIAGANAKAYTPKPADRGRPLSCRVTATNPTGSTSSTSVARTVR